MKTRSNMPLFVVETDNVKALSNSQIDLLRCGDYLVKKDASGEHAYKVTYKSDTGMCLTYMDASVVETQSYDKVDGNWVYNSEDKSELPINEEDPSFKPIYCHPIAIKDDTPNAGMRLTCLIFNNDPTPFTLTTFKDFIDELYTKTSGLGKIMISGGVNYSNVVIIASYITKITGLYYIVGIDASNGGSANKSGSFNDVIPAGATFEDGVNKIN